MSDKNQRCTGGGETKGVEVLIKQGGRGGGRHKGGRETMAMGIKHDKGPWGGDVGRGVDRGGVRPLYPKIRTLCLAVFTAGREMFALNCRMEQGQNNSLHTATFPVSSTPLPCFHPRQCWRSNIRGWGQKKLATTTASIATGMFAVIPVDGSTTNKKKRVKVDRWDIMYTG